MAELKQKKKTFWAELKKVLDWSKNVLGWKKCFGAEKRLGWKKSILGWKIKGNRPKEKKKKGGRKEKKKKGRLTRKKKEKEVCGVERKEK